MVITMIISFLIFCILASMKFYVFSYFFRIIYIIIALKLLKKYENSFTLVWLMIWTIAIIFIYILSISW